MTFDPNARPAPDQPSYAALLRQLQEAQTEVKQLKRTKKFGLVWEDKPDAQVERVFLEAPLLCEDREKAVVTDEGAVNHVLINGDNFHALTALRATHTGKVDVIYIDPPYNTGNKDFIYNDDYVDAEDGYRHSKWLSFMEKRLRLARELLADTGVIFVSIDDNEHPQVRLLLDQAFGTDNFVSTLVWRKTDTIKNDARYVSSGHEYVLVYAKKLSSLPPFDGVERTPEQKKAYKNPDNDPRGSYRLTPLYAKSGSASSSGFTHVFSNGQTWSPPQGRFNRFSSSTLTRLDQESRLLLDARGVNQPMKKTYLNEVKSNIVLSSLLPSEVFVSTRSSNLELSAILGKGAFQNPKPSKFVAPLVRAVTSKPDAIVLDFFAGSGTTAHAVAELNKADGGRRQCILVTDGGKTEETGHSGTNSNSNAVHIAEEITYERVRRVLTGQDWADGKEHEPLGGNLRYFNVHMENIQSYSERDEAAAFAPFTRSHASIATSAFTVAEEKRVDTVYGLPIDYAILSAPAGEDEVKYVVAVQAHDYELAELGEWFSALPEDADVTIMGHWLHEVEWVKENSARVKVLDVMEQVSASRKHAKSLVYT